MKDLRPVVLTSAVMKIFERAVLVHLQDIVKPFLDPLQFAYRKSRNVDDAILFVLNNIYKHLERANTCICIMFFDFSSAFNTIQPHLLANKLIKMGLPFPTISWVLDYLTDRPQFVKLNRSISAISHTNTGAPQGTVLSPFLFTLYTADCRSKTELCPLVKFADDSALTGLITKDDDTHYRRQIDMFVDWCDQNYLQLNVSKTKEMIIDFRKVRSCTAEITIKTETVQQVTSYKYLGVKIDNKLSWNENSMAVLKKTNGRMYCLRKLKSFNVCNQMLQMFYTSVVCSVLTFAAVCWGGNLCKTDKEKLEKVIKKAGGVVGRKQDTLSDMYNGKLIDRLKIILTDETHPMHDELSSRQSNRSNRLLAPPAKTSRYLNSFVPSAIRAYNQDLPNITEREVFT